MIKSKSCPCWNHDARDATLKVFDKIINEKDPISLLTEFATRNKIMVSLVETHDDMKSSEFTCFSKVNGKPFGNVYRSNSKLEGRKLAAASVLRAFAEQSFFRIPFLEEKLFPVHTAHTHYAVIATLVHTTFNESSFKDPVWLDCSDVIAAIVLELVAPLQGSGGDRWKDRLSVVAMTTGNRCIRSSCLMNNGKAVNDSHADVTVRRAFIRFLFAEINHYMKGNGSIFLRKPETGMLIVKPEVKFHFYLSTAPCGDAREYVRNTWKGPVIEIDATCHSPVYTTKTCGLLRAKVENGNGAIFTRQIIQNWKQIKGRRLYTMSCSDKLMMWNILGMQGSLLSHFMEPIYLNSMIIGEYCDVQHLSRAMCCRFGPWLSIPAPFKHNHPELSSWNQKLPDANIPKTAGGTTALAVNWTLGDDVIEVVDSTKGTPHFRNPVPPSDYSRISKYAMYSEFHKLCTLMGKSYVDRLIRPTYYETKQVAIHYQIVKTVTKTICKTQGLGDWISKPVDEEAFGL